MRRRAPAAERVGQDGPALRAADVHDGMQVAYQGTVWTVWSKSGPKAGQCWLVRHAGDGKPETVAARYGALDRA